MILQAEPQRADRPAKQAHSKGADTMHSATTPRLGRADANQRRAISDQEARLNNAALYTLLTLMGIAIIGLMSWYLHKPAVIAPAPVLNKMPAELPVQPIRTVPTPNPSASAPTAPSAPPAAAPLAANVPAPSPSPSAPVTATPPAASPSAPTTVTPATPPQQPGAAPDTNANSPTQMPPTNAADTTTPSSQNSSAAPEATPSAPAPPLSNP